MRKGILITGALGGLGRALVHAAEKLNDIDCIIASDSNREILKSYGGSSLIRPLVMDVSSEKSLQRARENIHRLGIRIKYLVNNAGLAMFFPISETDESQLDKIIKVNTYGPVLTVSTFLADLVENEGRVIQISSDNVRLPGLFQPYASSKIAMESLSVAMRQELGLRGVKLILVRPGAIQTDLLKALEHVEYLKESSLYKYEFTKFSGIARKEVGRIIEPSVVANLVVKAIQTKNPRLIYSINRNVKISSLVLFPQRWIDYLMMRSVFSK